MEVTPLTPRHWLVYIAITGISTLLGALAWHSLIDLFFPRLPPALPYLRLALLSLILLINACLLYLLIRLRLLIARQDWLKVWIVSTPLILGSVIQLPLTPLLLLPVVWCVCVLCALFGYYSCFSPLLELETNLHTCRYARRHELADLYTEKPPKTGLLLGVNHSHPLFRRFLCIRPTKTRRVLGNLLVVAPTQIGKSLLATAQLLSWQHSVIVNDIKGELYEQTAGWRASLGPVYVIDPTGVGHSFDPLLGKNTEDKLFSIALQMLDDASEKERIWTEKAARMLQQLFLAAQREGIPGLVYVRHLSRLGLSEVADRLHTIDPTLANQFLDEDYEHADFSNKMTQSCWATLTTKLHPFLTETVVRSFTKADFTPEQLMRGDKPVTVYLRWKEQDLHALSPLVRLLWGSLIDELITTYDSHRGKGCKPVLILIDEAGKTAIPSLADHSTTVVGRGIFLWVAIQSISQLETIYGKARGQTLKDNMETQLYHRTNDLLTAQYLEERCGHKSGFAKSTTGRQGANPSEGLAERPVPLLTAQEVMTLKDHELIGFHRFLHPFKLRRLEWWRHPVFAQRRAIQSPRLSILPAVASVPKLTASHLSSEATDDYIDPYAL